jgi:hypothetical protein
MEQPAARLNRADGKLHQRTDRQRLTIGHIELIWSFGRDRSDLLRLDLVICKWYRGRNQKNAAGKKWFDHDGLKKVTQSIGAIPAPATRNRRIAQGQRMTMRKDLKRSKNLPHLKVRMTFAPDVLRLPSLAATR